MLVNFKLLNAHVTKWIDDTFDHALIGDEAVITQMPEVVRGKVVYMTQPTAENMSIFMLNKLQGIVKSIDKLLRIKLFVLYETEKYGVRTQP